MRLSPTPRFAGQALPKREGLRKCISFSYPLLPRRGKGAGG